MYGVYVSGGIAMARCSCRCRCCSLRSCSYEWVTTDTYDPKNAKHREVKAGIEIGNSLPDITTGAAVRVLQCVLQCAWPCAGGRGLRWVHCLGCVHAVIGAGARDALPSH